MGQEFRPVNGQEYYNYYNLDSFLNKCKIKDNSYSFRFLKDFLNTKISMFTYKNLPGSLTSEIIETALTFNNFLCFYNSPIYGVVLCRYLPLGEYDIYWKPVYVDLLALNGSSIATHVSYKDIVLCRDNQMDIIPFITISEYIEKMSNIENTMFVNLELLKLPAIFTCDKQLVGTFKNLFKDIANFKPFVLGDKTVADSFQQFDIKLPINPEQLLEIFKNYRNFCLQSIGISATDTQKRERLLVGEVQSQNEYIDYVYNGMAEQRKQFVKLINEKFNLNIELVESYKIFLEENIEAKQKELLVTQETMKVGGNNGTSENV